MRQTEYVNTLNKNYNGNDRELIYSSGYFLNAPIYECSLSPCEFNQC